MKSKNPKLFCLTSLLIALVSVIVRVIISANFTHAQTGVYLNGTLLPQIYGYILTILLAILATWALISKKDFNNREYPVQTPLTVFTTAVFGFMMLACTVFFLFIAVSQKQMTVFEILIMASGAISAIYYLSRIFGRRSSQALGGLLSLAPIVWSIACLIELYFDMSILVSSPVRIFTQTSYLALMVFLLAESRVELGYPSTKLYAPSAAIASVMLLTSSVPALICNNILLIGNTDRPIIYATQLIAGLYAASKLISFCFFSKIKEI